MDSSNTEGEEEGGFSTTEGAAGTLAQIQIGKIVCSKSSKAAKALSIVLSNVSEKSLSYIETLDPNKEKRSAEKENTEGNISTIQAKQTALKEHQDTLEQDALEYQAFQDEVFIAQTDNINEIASLEMDLYDAQALGDDAASEEIQAQIDELSETKFDMGRLSELRMRLHSYEATKLESEGLAETAQTVSNFLKEGKTMRKAFNWAGAAYALCTTETLALIPISIASIREPIMDTIRVTAAGFFFTAASAMFGVSSGKAFKGASKEKGCFDEGIKYDAPLVKMINEGTKLDSKINETSSGYDTSDEETVANLEDINVAAEAAVQQNNFDASGTNTTPAGGYSGSGAGNQFA